MRATNARRRNPLGKNFLAACGRKVSVNHSASTVMTRACGVAPAALSFVPRSLRGPRFLRCERRFVMALNAKVAAEEAEAEADATEGESGKSKRKLPLRLILIAAGGLVVLAGAGTGAFMLLGHHAEEEKPALVVAKPVFFDVPEVLVNLSNAGSDRTQYLKVKVVLELPDQALTLQIQPIMPRVMDTFQTYLRELRPTDLEGSAGLYRLKEELTRRVNIAIAPNKVNAVLFKEIVVQ
jgi:flagellar FliL protein